MLGEIGCRREKVWVGVKWWVAVLDILRLGGVGTQADRTTIKPNTCLNGVVGGFQDKQVLNSTPPTYIPTFRPALLPTPFPRVSS